METVRVQVRRREPERVEVPAQATAAPRLVGRPIPPPAAVTPAQVGALGGILIAAGMLTGVLSLGEAAAARQELRKLTREDVRGH